MALESDFELNKHVSWRKSRLTASWRKEYQQRKGETADDQSDAEDDETDAVDDCSSNYSFTRHSVDPYLSDDVVDRSGTWYLPHSHVHNEGTLPIIMAGCIAHARNGRIPTSCLKSDVTIVFLDPDFR